MIDPFKPTQYDLPPRKLEEMLIFSILVAGKTAWVVSRQLDNMLRAINWLGNNSPLRCLGDYAHTSLLEQLLKAHGIGCYTAKAKSLLAVIQANLNLRTCTVKDLEAIYGIGPKTARFFILHTRRDARVAALDTHMLKWLREVDPAVSLNPPGKLRYVELEQRVLTEADFLGVTPAEFDLLTWKKYARTKGVTDDQGRAAKERARAAGQSRLG